MGKVYALNDLNVTFRAKVTNFVKDSDLDHTLISDQFIVFYKPRGKSFEKQATLVNDTTNPSQVITLSNIVGDGIEDKITVTVPNTALLKDGELITISGTANFDVSKKPVTIVDATKFTYLLDLVGNTTPETSGNVTTQGEKKVLYHNTTPEASILDEVGKWEYAVRVVLSNGDGFTTRDRGIFRVT